MATSKTRTSKTPVKSTTKAAAKTATKVASASATKPAAKQPAAKVAAKTAAKSATKAVTKTPTKAATETATKRSGSAATGSGAENKKVTLRGRSVFVVQTTSAGVTVRTAWLSEDQKLLEMPAVFPDVNYAVNLIDDLKRQVLKHFSQAAQVGAQAIANQKQSSQKGKKS